MKRLSKCFHVKRTSYVTIQIVSCYWTFPNNYTVNFLRTNVRYPSLILKDFRTKIIIIKN